jgi:hypothetical protein
VTIDADERQQQPQWGKNGRVINPDMIRWKKVSFVMTSTPGVQKR